MNNAAATKSFARQRAAYKAWETMREREDAVRAQFRGTAAERIESFMQYAHENEVEVVVAMQASADDTVEAMIAEYQSRVA